MLELSLDSSLLLLLLPDLSEAPPWLSPPSLPLWLDELLLLLEEEDDEESLPESEFDDDESEDEESPPPELLLMFEEKLIFLLEPKLKLFILIVFNIF